MKQILIIHGGTSFSSYESYRQYLDEKEINFEKLIHPHRWKQDIADKISDAEVIYASMPNYLNAVYDEWVVYFEKILPYLKDDVQIIGHSLGAMFLAKYLDEKPLDNVVKRLILVSGGYNDDSYEDLGSFELISARNVSQSAKEIHLFHSKDDPVVPFAELSKFQVDLPEAICHVFKDRGHFLGPEFPELITLLKQR